MGVKWIFRNIFYGLLNAYIQILRCQRGHLEQERQLQVVRQLLKRLPLYEKAGRVAY